MGVFISDLQLFHSWQGEVKYISKNLTHIYLKRATKKLEILIH